MSLFFVTILFSQAFSEKQRQSGANAGVVRVCGELVG
jgi:hypothetical protein